MQGKVWYYTSGAAEKAEKERARGAPTYEDIAPLGLSEFSSQIEKDLSRTFPEHEVFGKEEGVEWSWNRRWELDSDGLQLLENSFQD